MNYLKRLIFPLIVIGFALAIVTNTQNIMDWVRLRGYSPPAQIQTLAANTTMNSYGQKLFYVNHPSLLDKSSFSTKCNNNEQSIVLGCYIKNKGIYLYDVQDERLAGVEEVTAAHEMLHEAYERLDSEQKARIDKLTNDVYEKSADQRLRKTIDAYKKRDPSVVPNELHSIIATEISNLPIELENYYSQYFYNRKVVVALSERYESEFTKREQLAGEYKQQLDSIKEEVDRLTQELAAQSKDLEREYSVINSSRDNMSADEFNSEARDYNQKVQTYNSDVRYVSGLIDQYNGLTKKYNAVVLEENQLINSIDSRPNQISN